jgi:hypothetical protein
MAEPKTKQNDADVDAFVGKIADERRRDDCREVLQLMREATGSEPKMWGSAIVGFGTYRYKYDSGREGDWPIISFSPRKDNLTLYIAAGIERFPDLLSKLGKHKTGKGCLYVKKLEDVDLSVLRTLLQEAVEAMAGSRLA